MTTKERLHKLVDELSEEEAEAALRYVASRRRGANVDGWGDLDAQTDAAAGDLMARLDEEEMAEFGETIAEAWGYVKKDAQ